MSNLKALGDQWKAELIADVQKKCDMYARQAVACEQGGQFGEQILRMKAMHERMLAAITEPAAPTAPEQHADDHDAFEAWAQREGGVNLLPALIDVCEDGRFPASYFYAPTETAWRAWANKPVPARKALSDERLDYIARSYFANKRDQESVKGAIHDAFKEAQASAQPDVPETDCGNIPKQSTDAGWQPIDTAPKGANGYAFMQLAWGPEDNKSTGEGMRYGDKFFAACVFHCIGKDRQFEFHEKEVKPTHWSPSPAAPHQPVDHAGDANDMIMSAATANHLEGRMQ